MTMRPSNSSIWGGGVPPQSCQNCNAAAPVVFVGSKPTKTNRAAPMYLCAKCYYSGMVALIEDMGYLVLGPTMVAVQIPFPDPMSEVADEQARKQRDWKN